RRAAAERREERRRRLRKLRPRRPDRRTGKWLLRRTPGQRAAIAGFAAVAIGLIWYLVPAFPARVGLTVLVLLGLPAFVIIALDRRY
ncbi:MAG: hypothetical protein ACRDT4_04870, partial [Micromonosporaceae bacterium]